ncbi:unnamed protein product [Rhizophagus irregularis]|nr:unnamed protein product [Rhizophagus irregularis]
MRRPSTSSSITSVVTYSFIQKPKKKYISKADMLNALNNSNEVYTTCVAAMRICADYQLEYNYAYKDIPKNILFKIIEKFAYELLKKHVQHIRDHKTKNRNGYFKKSNQDKEEEEVRNKEQEEEEEVRNEEQEVKEEEEVKNEEQEVKEEEEVA